MKNILFFVLSFQTWKITLGKSAQFLSLFLLLGCGVKGDPMPPEKPPFIGRGEQTYKRATEEIFSPTAPAMMFGDEEKDGEKKDNEYGED